MAMLAGDIVYPVIGMIILEILTNEFSSGTRKIAQAVVLSQAYSVVGGGDTISILRKMELGEKFDYLSTGGGAMFEFLAEGTLPGILALQ